MKPKTMAQLKHENSAMRKELLRIAENKIHADWFWHSDTQDATSRLHALMDRDKDIVHLVHLLRVANDNLVEMKRKNDLEWWEKSEKEGREYKKANPDEIGKILADPTT